jgi:hypothetical protein
MNMDNFVHLLDAAAAAAALTLAAAASAVAAEAGKTGQGITSRDGLPRAGPHARPSPGRD